MGKQKQLEKKLTTPVKKTLLTGILPSSERPSEQPAAYHHGRGKTGLAASDLFSLFTADIIKEQKIFTR
ncbi:MAG: hypothetical protein ACXWWD_12345 [Chitinophagaceae bacterium]